MGLLAERLKYKFACVVALAGLTTTLVGAGIGIKGCNDVFSSSQSTPTGLRAGPYHIYKHEIINPELRQSGFLNLLASPFMMVAGVPITIAAVKKGRKIKERISDLENQGYFASQSPE